jgi:glucose/arabinose dehydrogenase
MALVVNRWTRRLPLIALLTTLIANSALAQTGQEVASHLPPPFATPSVTKNSKVIGWPADKTPQAPQGFQVSALIRDLENPRWLYFLPNGDLLVAQSGTRKAPNVITLFRDADHDGTPEIRETFLEGLKQPFGMALVGDTLFVGSTGAVTAYPYKAGDTKITAPGKKIVDLPAGGYNNHWTRNVLAKPDGSKLYISVGSGSNVAEHGIENERHRANILEANLDGSSLRVFASGLRNPVGMDWEPTSGVLWTAVNERDELGDELVPDYLTRVREGGFYGWPYAYFGPHEDPRRKGERPDLVAKTIVPDVPLGAHTASLGLAFYKADAFPEHYRGGAFVGQHGSWNRSKFAGYNVVYVPFKDGKPAGAMEDFLTGFIANDADVYGRPVGVAVAPDGSLLVADDSGNAIWRVSAVK